MGVVELHTQSGRRRLASTEESAFLSAQSQAPPARRKGKRKVRQCHAPLCLFRLRPWRQDRYGRCRVRCAVVRRDGRPIRTKEGDGSSTGATLWAEYARVRPGRYEADNDRRWAVDDNDRRRQRTKRTAEEGEEEEGDGMVASCSTALATLDHAMHVVGWTDHRTGRRNWSPPSAESTLSLPITGLTQNVCRRLQ